MKKTLVVEYTGYDHETDSLIKTITGLRRSEGGYFSLTQTRDLSFWDKSEKILEAEAALLSLKASNSWSIPGLHVVVIED